MGLGAASQTMSRHLRLIKRSIGLDASSSCSRSGVWGPVLGGLRARVSALGDKYSELFSVLGA